MKNKKYVCKKKKEIIRYILTKYLQFSKLRKIIQANKMKKAKFNYIDLYSIFIMPVLLKKNNKIHTKNWSLWAILKFKLG